ncbi:MAG: imidazole glycerol phosphate synthase subunit HisH [Alphaproteobacteria bacterium]|nr:imidazole glycerol phosphate synthase subunit HisH [Alphaproteobacteria bacterium]
MATVAIVDYGMGNLRSVAGAVAKVGHTPVVTRAAATLADADCLVLPGVGAFPDAMRSIGRHGLDAALDIEVRQRGKPLLGICLGAQLVTRSSEEFGLHGGLGWVEARVRRIAPDDTSLRVPHVGWNDLFRTRDCPLLDGVPDDALFYYVHSYCIDSDDASVVVGECDYGGRFVAALARDNVWATQFHPEKSQRHGLAVLANFIERCH